MAGNRFIMKLDKWTVALILGLVLIGVLVWLGIENKWFSPKTKLSVKDGEGAVKTDDNGKASTEYTRIAQNAHDQLIGTNWNLLNPVSDASWEDIVLALSKLNNNELRIVVNEYDRLFSDSTLRGLINNEMTGCWSKSYYNSTDSCYQYHDVKGRLNQINA